MRPVPLNPAPPADDDGKLQWLIDRVTQLCTASQVDNPVDVAYEMAGLYQPLDDDLTQISSTATTAYGRAFLTFANEAAFKSAVNLEAGTDLYAPGGTDVALADGGTGASLTDPGADRILFWDESSGPSGAVTWLAPTSGLEISGTDLRMTAAQRTANIVWVIDGGGAVITTGQKGYIEIPFACTITKVTALADQTGSIVVDVWKDTYANALPTDSDSITASAPVSISSSTKSQDSTLTGWTTAVAAGDVIGFNVDSVTSIQRLTITLTVTKT